jgi:5'-3' exonuclease
MVHWEDEKEQSVIVSIDKDLLQIPGSHYNFVKSEFTEVSEEEGMFSFYIQLLMGDSTDNVSGCPGIGPKKAEKALRPFIGDEEGMYRAVVDKYTEAYPQLAEEEIEDIIITTGRLVWIRRKEGELWLPPIIQ